jgi:hypothetical protein
MEAKDPQFNKRRSDFETVYGNLFGTSSGPYNLEEMKRRIAAKEADHKHDFNDGKYNTNCVDCGAPNPQEGDHEKD